MLDRLPVELVTKVFRAAARAFIITDRRSIVNLALTCSTAYASVASILYETFVWPRTWTTDRVSAYADNAFKTRVCAHVQTFICERSFPGPTPDIRHLFPRLRYVAGTSDAIRLAYSDMRENTQKHNDNMSLSDTVGAGSSQQNRPQAAFVMDHATDDYSVHLSWLECLTQFACILGTWNDTTSAVVLNARNIRHLCWTDVVASPRSPPLMPCEQFDHYLRGALAAHHVQRIDIRVYDLVGTSGKQVAKYMDIVASLESPDRARVNLQIVDRVYIDAHRDHEMRLDHALRDLIVHNTFADEPAPIC